MHKALIAADNANRAKSTFLLNMSHDIRTPLNGIMGLLKINMAHSDDEELVRENNQKMEKAANHLLSLINDVLQMSKLEDSREEFSAELVCLPDVFYDVKAIIDGSAMDKGIPLDFSGDMCFCTSVRYNESAVFATDIFECIWKQHQIYKFWWENFDKTGMHRRKG